MIFGDPLDWPEEICIEVALYALEECLTLCPLVNQCLRVRAILAVV